MAAEGVSALGAAGRAAGLGDGRRYPKIDFQDQYYYARPKSMAVRPKSLDEVDPELLATYEKLGIPLKEQMILAGVEGADGAPAEGRKVAVDAVFDSVSLGTTFKAELAKAGVIFCSISEAVREHPELVQKYLGSVVPYSDNFYATLNSAVFSDGSFVYVPPGVRCPMELSTYFRINAENTGQFERTLIIADKGSLRQLPRGLHRAASATSRQLHAAVVEIVALEDAEVKYSTVQNWYPGRRGGPRRHLQLRHQARRLPRGAREGDVDAGRDRLGDHLEVSRPASCAARGARASSTRSPSPTTTSRPTPAPRCTIWARTPGAGSSRRGSARASRRTPIAGWSAMHPKATGSRNYTQCDSLLIGDQCGAHTVPYIEVQEQLEPGGARGDDLEGRRGPALLLPPARHGRGGGGGAGRQRLLPRGAAGAADGVRHRGAEAGGDQPRGERRVTGAADRATSAHWTTRRRRRRCRCRLRASGRDRRQGHRRRDLATSLAIGCAASVSRSSTW